MMKRADNLRKNPRICPVEMAGMLDATIRKWIHDPGRILHPYITEGMSVLDLGCGPGFFTLEMARRVGERGRVTAADLQPGMLEKARGKLAAAGLAARVAFHQCRADSIGLPPGARFDFILVFYMLHEVPGPAAFVCELKALLSPGGRILLAEPKWHVSQEAFRESLALMAGNGWRELGAPALCFSRTALLGNGGTMQAWEAKGASRGG